MLVTTSQLPLASEAPARAPKARIWRPFPREEADIVAVDDRGGGGELRMYPWYGISLVRSPAMATVESRRDVLADRNWVFLVPAFQLFGVRAVGKAEHGTSTLLLGASHLEGLHLPPQAALVTDSVLGEKVAALIARCQQPLRSLEHAATIRPLLEQLLAGSTPLAAGRPRQSSQLASARTFLHGHLGELVSTGDLSRISGVSESHLIRAFHYEFGLPPHAYGLRLRLAAACERLARGVAVASVAYECGFADQSHLSRKFKTVYGLTPAVWAAAAAGGAGYDMGLSSAELEHPFAVRGRDANAGRC